MQHALDKHTRRREKNREIIHAQRSEEKHVVRSRNGEKITILFPNN
jgi:hypothetical protein